MDINIITQGAITVDELISKLQIIKQENGGDTKAHVCDPCADGIGFRVLPISDAHMNNGSCHVQVPCSYYEKR